MGIQMIHQIKNRKSIYVFLFILSLSLFLFYINFSFTTNFYFNGDESLIIKAINQLLEKGVRAFGGFYWKRSIPLFPIPFFKFFGTNLIAFRVSQSFMLALSFFVFFYFVRSFYNNKLALLTIVLLLIFPSFSLFLVNEYPFTLLLITLLLFLFGKWYQTKNRNYLFSLFFILGFGIFTDLVIVYTGISLLVGYLVLSFFGSKKLKIKPNKNHILYSICFLIGVSPMIYINLSTNFYQWSNLFTQALNPKTGQYSNLALFANLREVFLGLNKTLANADQYIGFEKTPLNIPIFYFSVLLLIWMRDKKDYFLLVFTFTSLFFLIFQPQWFKDIHISFVLLPLILIVIKGVYLLMKRNNQIVRFLGYFLFGLFILTNSISLVHSYQKWDQEYIEKEIPHKALFNLKASTKYGKEGVYFGDRIIDWHLRKEFPSPSVEDSKTYLCKDIRNPRLGGVGFYGYTSGFNCSFENKIDKNSLCLFPTNSFLEEAMGDEYYKRNTSIYIEGDEYYYPFYSFKKYLNKRNLTFTLYDKIKNSKGKVMYRIYKISKE